MYLLLRFFVNQPAAVEPMKIVIDEDMWRLPCNRAPPRKHSEEKQKEIRNQVDELLELYAIDNLLDVGNGPSFESTSGRVQSNKVKGEAPLLKLTFRSRLGY